MAKKKVKPLSYQQEHYALLRAQGYTKKASCLAAGYHSGHGTALEKNSQMVLRIVEIQGEMKDRLIADAVERQQFWTRGMRGQIDGISTGESLRASELLGKAQGDFIERFMNIDLDGFTDEQLARVAAGENPVRVLAGDDVE